MNFVKALKSIGAYAVYAAKADLQEKVGQLLPKLAFSGY